MIMLRKLTVLSCILLVACAPEAPSSLPASTPVPTSSPAPLPSPMPTATPVPPLMVDVLWPAGVSALQPVPIEVAVMVPPGAGPPSVVRVSILDPQGVTYAQFGLSPREGNLYAAAEPLRLPFLPAEGDWRLVVHVWSPLEVTGEQEVVFRPAAIPLRDLTAVLPAGAILRVPQAFAEVTALGDQVAGGRVWRYEGGEVGLWWAPGPVKPLRLNNAVVMLETTYGIEVPQVAEADEMAWQGQTAFLFRERWPGPEGGPGEALVVQGPDYWLYVLRVRAVGEQEIPALLREVRDTFAFSEG